MTGSSLIGTTVTTVNPIYTAAEIATQLKLSKARTVATLKSFVPKVKEAFEKLGGKAIR